MLDSLPTRHSLLNRVKDPEDQTAWRGFFETYWGLVYNFARKAGLTDSEAQDAAQNTLIAVSRSIAGFERRRERGGFKAWLLQQTRWRIADQFRKRDKFATPDHASGNGGPTPQAEDATGTATINRIPDPGSLEVDETWNEDWKKHLLKTALERIKAGASDKQFQMFDLHALQGLSAKETAHTLGASVVAVHMATSRLRSKLRREIKRLEKLGG